MILVFFIISLIAFNILSLFYPTAHSTKNTLRILFIIPFIALKLLRCFIILFIALNVLSLLYHTILNIKIAHNILIIIPLIALKLLIASC